jgi:hypothetical protein
MITSRPQTTNLLSFVFFLLIAGALVVINLLSLLRDPEPPWFNYLVVAGLVPVILFIIYKIFFRYKVVTMGNGQIIVSWPQFRTSRKYTLKEVVSWSETIVKTGKNSSYKELEIKFRDGRAITMAYREYTDYEKLSGYLAQKLPKIKLTDS